MATPVATAAVKALRPIGGKQIFLPQHVVKMVRPKDNQPPNLATFSVPLTFNKFDIRDYLFHAYNVEVTGVRSFVNQRRLQKKYRRLGWYRPQAGKMMIAELVKPFVWPKILELKERGDFDYKTWFTMENEQDKINDESLLREKGRQKPRDLEMTHDILLMKKQAKLFLDDPASWAFGGLRSTEKWREVEVDVKLDKNK
ncbi:hypothetical protein B0H67DRAFT_554224 [Lasiosphaeris hirsuta]|uniref:Large ribosomal subunit protein uL23m n=1 Tax=Lasiosphaeris hirsuta TaxID=260670 RepID=A0AA40AH93_9PEZI|nr:hypothetical protein B0H67DRAFT_554224 [Lasiosphaeris hirsuta]